MFIQLVCITDSMIWMRIVSTSEIWQSKSVIQESVQKKMQKWVAIILFIKFNLKNKKSITKFYNPRRFPTDIKIKTLWNKKLTGREAEHVS